MPRETRASSARSKEQSTPTDTTASTPATKKSGAANRGKGKKGGDEAPADAPSASHTNPKPKPKPVNKKKEAANAAAADSEAEKARKRALSAADEENKKPRKKKPTEKPADNVPPARNTKRSADDDSTAAEEGNAPKAKKPRQADKVTPKVDDEGEDDANANADVEAESDTNLEGDEFVLVDEAAEESAAEATENKPVSKKSLKLAAQLEAGEPKRMRDSKLNKPGSRPKKFELFEGTVNLDEDEDGSDLSDLTDIDKAPVPKEKSVAAPTDKGKGKQVAEAPATIPRTSAAKPSAPSASAAEKGKGKAVAGTPAATRTPVAKPSAPSASTSSSSKSAAPMSTPAQTAKGMNSAAPKSAPAQTPKRQQKITAAFEAAPVKVKQEPDTPVDAQSGSSKPSNSKSKIPKVENEAGPSIQVKSEPGVSVKKELDEDVKPDVKGFKRKDYTPPVYLRIDSDGNEFIEISSDEDEHAADANNTADAINTADANDANGVEQADGANDGNNSDVVQELTAEEVAALNTWNAAELQHHVDARAHHLANGKIGGVSSHSSRVVKKAFSDAVNIHHPAILLLGDRGMYPRRNDEDDDELTDDDIARAGAADAFLMAIDKGDQFAPLRARCAADPDFLERCAEAVNERRSQFRNKLAKLVPIVLERAYDLTRLTQAKKVDETAIMNAIAALLKDDNFVFDGELQRIAGSDNRFKYVIKQDMDDVPYWHPVFHAYLGCAVMGKAQGGHPLKATLFPDAMYEQKQVKKGDKEVPVVTLGFAVTMIEYGLKNWATGSYTYVELKGSHVKDTYWRHIEALQGFEDSEFLNATLWRAYQQARAWTRPGQRKEKARAPKTSANAAKIAALLAN